jgi:hypothetical protein
MAELEQLGTLDPQAREKLIADLKQADPSLWPLVLQQYRAALAYRRQVEQRSPSGGGPLRPGELAAAPPSQNGDGSQNGDAASIGKVGVDNAAKTNCVPGSAPDNAGRTSCVPVSAAVPSAKPAEPAKAVEPPGAVQRASYDAPVPATWQAHLAAAIEQIEAQDKASPKGESDAGREARLRMLYLLAGRREEAMRPIPAAASATQDYWAKQLYGLSTWLDTERNPDPMRRAADTKRILSEAIAHLGESAPLVVRNMAFCTAVQSYGSITPFKKCEFAPDQEVLLYAEVENFMAEPTPKGFHTSLKSSYQILDNRGQRVAENEFPATEETCQNQRRDFFIGYHVHLPKRIYPGKHTLLLTIVDLQSQKVGQSSVEFTVKGGEE